MSRDCSDGDRDRFEGKKGEECLRRRSYEEDDWISGEQKLEAIFEGDRGKERLTAALFCDVSGFPNGEFERIYNGERGKERVVKELPLSPTMPHPLSNVKLFCD